MIIIEGFRRGVIDRKKSVQHITTMLLLDLKIIWMKYEHNWSNVIEWLNIFVKNYLLF